jgi:predicted enzyme related to lactoylglutathione lyase
VNFNNIMIGTDNAEAMVEYYTKLFGPPAFSEGGFSGWQFGDGFVSIGEHSEVHGKNEQPGRLIWNMEDADVRGTFERLKAAGAIVIKEPYELDSAPGWAIATLADPDGNYFQLTTPYESAGMGGGQDSGD